MEMKVERRKQRMEGWMQGYVSLYGPCCPLVAIAVGTNTGNMRETQLWVFPLVTAVVAEVANYPPPENTAFSQYLREPKLAPEI